MLTVPTAAIQTTDLHHHVVGYGPQADATRLVGGYARLATKINEIRTSTLNPVIVVDSGDFFMGTVYDFSFMSTPVSTAYFQFAGYDAITLGNHEFDDGTGTLRSFAGSVNFPLLCANCDFTNEPELNSDLIKPWIVKEVGGEKIGIMGLVTPDTGILSNDQKPPPQFQWPSQSPYL